MVTVTHPPQSVKPSHNQTQHTRMVYYDPRTLAWYWVARGRFAGQWYPATRPAGESRARRCGEIWDAPGLAQAELDRIAEDLNLVRKPHLAGLRGFK